MFFYIPFTRVFLSVLPKNGFYEDHVMLVVILFTVRQSFPRVSCRDTPSFDTPVVTDLDELEGVRQNILKRQVFNRCVIG